jgi:pyruvate/2-oxoglutarate dehydrogenase complex dihydrolipoamide dehydrogenase (E3) component/uncharacterized membrane protein YdjX (TVP38/TMEM64 family)
MKKSSQLRWWILVLVGLAVVAFFALGFGRYLNLDTIRSQQLHLQGWRQANPMAAALGFMGIYIAVTALSLPGATVLTLAAGAVFGLGWGTLLASFSASIGATLAFLLARFVLRDWVREKFASRLESIDAGLKKDGAFYLFTLRLVPAIPFFLINLAMGLTGIGVVTFYVVSQIGMLAGTLVYVNAGTQLAQIRSLSDVASPSLILSLVLLGVLPLIVKKSLDIFRARKALRRWKKPARFERNLVVIGAGSAGLVTSYIAAAVKASVTLVERERPGGDCLYTGCVPSKALIHSARLMHEIQGADAAGIRNAQGEVDFAAVMERLQRVITEIEPHDSPERYRGLGVDVVQGEARLVSPWEVEVTTRDGTQRRITSRAIVIATGAHPVVPKIEGIEATGYYTSDTLWGLRVLPRRLLVLGGGAIGCELSQAFARLGAEVTMVEAGDRLLSREDDAVCNLVQKRFEAEGIRVLFGHTAERFERQASTGDGAASDTEGSDQVLIARHRNGEVRIGFDALLVAVGRKARLEGYGLEALGIKTGKTIDADAFLQTTIPTIYAAGDVVGPYQFTHTASHQAWYAAVNALFAPFKRFKVDYRVIPAATFVDPEVARVGLNEREAREKKTPYELTCYDIAELDRAIADDARRGFVRVLTIPGKDIILGVTIVGAHAADLLAEYVLAMKHGIGLKKILGTIHTYPTMSEANKSAAGVWRNAHKPERLLRLVERFHRWRLG